MSFRLCGGHRVGYRQLLPGIVVPQPEPPLQRHGLERRAHLPAADHLARPKGVQHRFDRGRLRRQRGVEAAPLPHHRQGQDHAVGQHRLPQIRGGPRGALRPLQAPGMDGMSVVQEQFRQPDLPLVPAHDPYIAFVPHGLLLRLSSAPSYSSGGKRCHAH